jgi:outer membrane murein-binding lipoprotein Lpp
MDRTTRYRKATSLISIALAIGFLVSCASSPEKVPTLSDKTASQWNATVDKHIPDVQRAGNLKQLGQKLAALQESLSRDVIELNEKTVVLNMNYDATKEEARQLIADFSVKRNAALEKYRDIIFAMRREVSADEWKALTK